MVLPSTHFGGAVTVAERIWREVTEKRFTVDNVKYHTIAVSIGVGLYPSRDVRTKDSFVRAADGALQQAKRDGGNRVCVFQQQGYIYTPALGAAQPRTGSGGGNTRGEAAMTALHSVLPAHRRSMRPRATIVPADPAERPKIELRACSWSTTSPTFGAAWRAF